MPGHPSMNSAESEILNSLSPPAELSGMMKLPEIVIGQFHNYYSMIVSFILTSL